VLAAKLRKLSREIEVPPSFGFSQWRKIVADIKKQPDETRIFISGHSMGANQASAAAAMLGTRKVDLIAAFEPTIWYQFEKIR
jgi:predicted alpha/beta-hydrolase family hydrolase